MKKLSIVVLLATLGFSGSLTLMPYGSYIGYSSVANKDHAYLEGVYASFYNFPCKVEVDAENLLIKYKDDTTPDWKQQDLTLVGHYYIGKNYAVKAGIHNMFVNNGEKFYEKTLIGGILYYQYLKYNAGVDYYFTNLRGFHVSQITPRAGISFGNYNSYDGSFYLEAKVNFIKISDANQAPKDNYTNVDLKLENFKGPWTTTLTASVGKAAYKVGGDGFVVYNTGDEYKYEGGVKVNYKITKKDNVSVSFNRSAYKVNDATAYANTYLLSYAHTF